MQINTLFVRPFEKVSNAVVFMTIVSYIFKSDLICEHENLKGPVDTYNERYCVAFVFFTNFIAHKMTLIYRRCPHEFPMVKLRMIIVNLV